MEWIEFLKDALKVYGPLSLGWPVAGYLLIFILKRYEADIDSKIKLALALQEMSEAIKGLRK